MEMSAGIRCQQATYSVTCRRPDILCNTHKSCTLLCLWLHTCVINGGFSHETVTMS